MFITVLFFSQNRTVLFLLKLKAVVLLTKLQSNRQIQINGLPEHWDAYLCQ